MPYNTSVSPPPNAPFFVGNERKEGSGMGWTAFYLEQCGLCKESQAEILLRKPGPVCLLRAE